MKPCCTRNILDSNNVVCNARPNVALFAQGALWYETTRINRFGPVPETRQHDDPLNRHVYGYDFHSRCGCVRDVMAKSARRLVISVEGNIASSKSTLLNRLNLEGYRTYPEPINLWENVGGQPLLAMWYADKPTYRQLLDTRIQLTMFDRDINLHPTGVNIIERSLYSNRMVFSREESNHSSDPRKNAIEQEISLGLFKTLVQFYPSIGIIIYLDCSPELCCHRSRIRKREAEETGLDLSYIQRLDTYYRQWLIDRTYGYAPAEVRVIQVHATTSEEEVIEQAKLIIR